MEKTEVCDIFSPQVFIVSDSKFVGKLQCKAN